MRYGSGLYEAALRSLWEPRYELRLPKPGLRHQSRPRIVGHRFPVKDGLNFRQALYHDMMKPSPLMRQLVSTAKPTKEST